MKTLHLNFLPFIYKMMQASKANESVSECSKTGLCITVKFYGCCHKETHESHLNMTRSSHVITRNVEGLLKVCLIV